MSSRRKYQHIYTYCATNDIFSHISPCTSTRKTQIIVSPMLIPRVNTASEFKPLQREVGMTALPEVKSVERGPDEPAYFIDSMFPDLDDLPMVEEVETFVADDVVRIDR
ncbi:hypothetical protein CHS0354_007200 [Potamilus streckersoni]|uniref:Uncharacterized protein n=1 Tax=Potamilus streckersoni TaxID=2493646 RepID=A0AAE0T6H1_9BIVA|nr:hypothetical protein CHS0354_007200 [Potamilus streckersoni]